MKAMAFLLLVIRLSLILSIFDHASIIEELWVDLNPNLGGEIPDFIGDKTTLGKSDICSV